MIGDRKGGMLEIVRVMATQAQLKNLGEQIEALQGKLAKKGRPADRTELAAIAAEKLSRGMRVTRDEAAAYLGVSKRHLQRLEDRGKLERCPDCDHPVFYAARDVLRLASAMRKEA